MKDAFIYIRNGKERKLDLITSIEDINVKYFFLVLTDHKLDSFVSSFNIKTGK